MYRKLSDNPTSNPLSTINSTDYCIAFTEQTRDGLLLINETGKVIFWNAAMESILGLNQAEALNQPIWEIHLRMRGPDSTDTHTIDQLKQNIIRALQTGKADWMEGIIDHEITLEDGTRKFVQEQCFPLPFGQGFMIGCIMRDVTREKAIVNQLKQDQALLQSIITNVQEAVFTFDLDGQFTFISPGWIENHGYTSDEVMGHKFSDYVHPDDIDGCWRSLREVINTGQSVNDIEFRILRKNGTYAWYLSSATLVKDDRGEPSFIIGIATDIIERKKMEAALRESEARLRLIQNNMTDIVLQSDLNGMYIYVSPSYERLFGYPCLPGVSSIFDYIHPHDLSQVHAAIQEGLDGSDLVCVEYRHQVKDGGYIWLESLGSVLRDGYGNPTGLQVTSRDITSRRIYQDKLEYMSVHDVLTGLYNRTYFEAEVRRLESGRFDPLSVIVVDSDGLKQVNDNLGHQIGDRLLQTIADLLRLSFRDSDILARMGGDEFIVLCPCCGEADITGLLERLTQNIKICNQDQPQVPVCMSFGYTVRNDSSVPIFEVIREADGKMYENKTANRRKSRRIFRQAGLR